MEGGGGMFGGWRGTNPGSMFAPNRDNLSDDTVIGKVYDNRVVKRLLTYLVPYRRDAMITLAAMVVYTAANVGIPLVIMHGINWGINSGDLWRLHVVGLIFFGVALAHFGANYLQLVAMARVGQGVLYSLRTQLLTTSSPCPRPSFTAPRSDASCRAVKAMSCSCKRRLSCW